MVSEVAPPKTDRDWGGVGVMLVMVLGWLYGGTKRCSGLAMKSVGVDNRLVASR